MKILHKRRSIDGNCPICSNAIPRLVSKHTPELTSKNNSDACSHLYSEQSHGDQTDPAVQGVEVGNWGGLGQVVAIQDRQESNGDARNRQGVEDGVQQLDVDPPTAPTYPVQKHS